MAGLIQRAEVNLHLIQDRQQPTHCPITAASQQLDARNLPEHLNGRLGTALRQIEDLSRVQKPLELLHELGALVAARLWVQEHQDGRYGGRRDRLDTEWAWILVVVVVIVCFTRDRLGALTGSGSPPPVLIRAVLQAGLEAALSEREKEKMRQRILSLILFNISAYLGTLTIHDGGTMALACTPRSHFSSASFALRQLSLLWYEYLHQEQLTPTTSLEEPRLSLDWKALLQCLHLPCKKKENDIVETLILTVFFNI